MERRKEERGQHLYSLHEEGEEDKEEKGKGLQLQGGKKKGLQLKGGKKGGKKKRKEEERKEKRGKEEEKEGEGYNYGWERRKEE
ncbi:hypothetical protein B296_00008179 [Ensete ventricosum]|uniref:Uncharacterized protein n=1 Tax=Ensete ventricosum TaxID=4639 RepID=A0A427BBB6_ENSVE|nr:hypothetical protein B296_00008179 [Ensete ventricosum]